MGKETTSSKVKKAPEVAKRAPAVPRELSALHQVQPPWFDRVLLAIRTPSIVTAAQWAVQSKRLHLSYIHYISASAPVLTGQLHRELAPPHWGRVHVKEPGTRNPVFVSGMLEDWAPPQAELDAGNVATWPMDKLDLTPEEDEPVAVGSDPTLLKVKATWCCNAAATNSAAAKKQGGGPVGWVVLCLRLHAALASDVGAVDLVRQWVIAHKAEFGVPKPADQVEGEKPLFDPPPPPPARFFEVKTIPLDCSGAQGGLLLGAGAALPSGGPPPEPYPAYGFRQELPPLFTAQQEALQRQRTADLRLLRLRYENMAVSAVVSNAVFALREAERLGAEASAAWAQKTTGGPPTQLLLPAPPVVKQLMPSGAAASDADGLCVSISLPILAKLEARRQHDGEPPQNAVAAAAAAAAVPVDYLGPVNIHQRVQLPAVCGSPLGPPAERVLRNAIDAALTDDEQLRQLALFEMWEKCRHDRLAGYFLPRTGPDHVDQFEVTVSPLLFDEMHKRKQQPPAQGQQKGEQQQQQQRPGDDDDGSSSSTTAGALPDHPAYAMLDFFRNEHAPPYILHCPPFAIPHRLVVCNAPARVLLPSAAASDANGRCLQPVTLATVMDALDVIVPVPATLVSKFLGVMTLRGRFIGEALPPGAV